MATPRDGDGCLCCCLVSDSPGRGRCGRVSRGDPVIAFHYAVDAVTHVKKFDQTIEVTGGTFVGGIDLETADLEGVLSLPTTEFTFTLAGIGLVTATAQIVPTQPVTGRVDFSHLPKIALTATAVFNIRIINAHATGTNLNLVGDSCTTASPVTVTMSANANLDGPTTMAGEFTLPPFQDCGGRLRRPRHARHLRAGKHVHRHGHATLIRRDPSAAFAQPCWKTSRNSISPLFPTCAGPPDGFEML